MIIIWSFAIAQFQDISIKIVADMLDALEEDYNNAFTFQDTVDLTVAFLDIENEANQVR